MSQMFLETSSSQFQIIVFPEKVNRIMLLPHKCSLGCRPFRLLMPLWIGAWWTTLPAWWKTVRHLSVYLSVICVVFSTGTIHRNAGLT